MTTTPFPRRPGFRPSRRGVALRRWSMKNFKSVRDSGIEIRPLTVVVGANSAGKSTLLQSIRAASQATASTGYLYPLNGRGVRLGTVSELMYRGPDADEEPIVLSAEFDLREPRGVAGTGGRLTDPLLPPQIATLAWEIGLSRSTQQAGIAQIQRLNVDLRPSGPESRSPGDGRDDGSENGYGDGRGGGYGDGRGTVGRAWILATADEAFAGELLEDEDNPVSPRYFNGTFSGQEGGPMEVVDVNVVGGFPVDASVMRPRAEVLFELWLSSVLRNPAARRADAGSPVLPGFEDRSVVARLQDQVTDALLEVNRLSEGSPNLQRDLRINMDPHLARSVDLNIVTSESFSEAVKRRLIEAGVDGEVPIPHGLDDLGPASSAVSDYLATNVRYLGPLREEPRAAYPDSPEGDDTYVGVKGEFTASVLQRHGKRRISAPTPDGDRRTLQLITHVNRWSEFLEIGQSFTVSDQGRFGIQLQVRQTDVRGDLDLTSVGTGVSQLLPVIVMCLQAPIGALLLIEQPELHLNPKVQQRLADFLLAIARSGRHLIVETHSEYLISRLRLHIAQDQEDEVQNLIGIYFAERTDGATTYNPVITNEYGGVDDWPDNFFDQATDEAHAILSAAVRKRRAKASSEK